MNAVVVLPTYNERPNLPRVAEGILRHDFTRLLVVDDASPDGTGDLADEMAAQSGGRIEVMHRTGPRGLGLAYIDGLKQAIASGADRVAQMDADLSHDPRHLPELLAASAEFDLVIGSRYAPGADLLNWPLHRKVLSAFANRYVRTITGLTASDCTNSYRMWRREALATLPLDRIRSNGYSFLAEMLYEARRAGCTVGEVPIVFAQRVEGASKISRKVLVESIVTPWRLVLRRGRLRRQHH
jgi:dolichol-phosphate mannosyltransferase